MRRVAWRTLDAVAAVLIALVSIVEILLLDDRRGPVALNVVVIAAMTLPAAYRRRWPVQAAVAFAVPAVVQNVLLTSFDDSFTPFLACLLVSYGAGAFADARPALAALAVLLAGVNGLMAFSEQVEWGDFFFPTAFVLLAWLAGRASRHRSRLAAELHEAAVQADERRAGEAQRAVAEERRRIAREMHDVVAHSMSVMVVQAGGARRILRQEPARAEEAGARIEQTGREALAEMRQLLGFLRPDGERPARAPQPGLGELAALVERARGAGLPVAVRVEGEPRPLAPGLDLAAYRIVQEGLTNALKHAGAAPTEVAVRWAPGALELEVADRGAGGSGPALVNGSGHGLVGMGERVRLYGGELKTGRRPGGGFAVRARLPVEDTRPTSSQEPV
jgi:signal transduction histidine kinase